MANEQNLKPILDSQRARELQVKSVQKRKENIEKEKSFKAMLLLELDNKNPETGRTWREDIQKSIIERAMIGDTKAYEVIRDTIGEKPVEKAAISTGDTLEEALKRVEGNEY